VTSLLFEDCTELECASVLGSQATVPKGVAYTANNPGACDPGVFVGESTIVLGGEVHSNGPTTARWRVLLDPSLIKRCDSGYLVICCERTHGGLHSKRPGAVARVSVNGHNRDVINLRDVPIGHTDFFHRPPSPLHLPPLWPISGCATVYAWPIDSRHLATSESQHVTVELEQDVSWDIDYVCVVLSEKSRHVRDACKQVGYVVLGAVLGAIASIAIDK